MFQKIINYNNCNLNNIHNGEPACFICLDESCKQTPLLCSVCKFENHEKHYCKPLKTILIDIHKKLSQIEIKPIDPTSTILLIEESLNTSINLLHENMAKFQIKTSELIEVVTQLHENLKYRAINYGMTKADILNSLIEIYKCEDFNVKNKVSSILDSINASVNFENFENPQKTFVGSLKNFSYEIEKLISSFNLATEASLNKIISDLKSFKTKEKEFELKEFEFCEPTDFKTLIKIMKPQIIKTTDSLIHHFIVPMNKPLSQLTNQSFSFKINKSSNGGWFGFGICHKNIVTKNNFKFNYSLVGHGCYMISNNGGSWSHKDSTSNNCVKTFNFVEGNIISVRYKITENVLIFEKKNSNSKYSLSIKKIADDPFYPCVVLYYQPTEIEFMNF